MSDNTVVVNKFEFLNKAESIITAAKKCLGTIHCDSLHINSLLYVIGGYKDLLNKEYVKAGCFEMDVATALGWDSCGVPYVDQIKKLVQENKEMKEFVVKMTNNIKEKKEK